MKATTPISLALALAMGLPLAAHADNGRGNGNGQDRGKQEDNRDRGNNDRQDDRGHRGNGNQNRENRGNGNRNGNGNDRPDVVVLRSDGNRDNRVVVVEQDRDRRDRDRDVVILTRDWDRQVIVGCPPGLAKKDNGCMPPGQAKKVAHARYDWLWNRRDNYVYRYDNGYLYRSSQDGNLMGYLPLLAGALGIGNPWPTQYSYQPAPTYFVNYYRAPEQYQYRYADGVMYGVDPKTQAIQSVVALLTGQQWNVGQAMPQGYDVYNVPYAYRGQYADGPDRMYRYSDGYVYQVDPKTRLIQAAIQLLA